MKINTEIIETPKLSVKPEITYRTYLINRTLATTRIEPLQFQNYAQYGNTD